MSNTRPPLRIVHCVRSAVGGTFRHVADLATQQQQAGHSVGLALDTRFGGTFETRRLEALRPRLELGVIELPVSYRPGLGDIATAARFMAALRGVSPDVLHGHGAKGGLLARIVGRAMRRRGGPPATFYTPHGGSLHHAATSGSGRIYFLAERMLESGCDGLLHVSIHERDVYRAKVRVPRCPAHVIANGLRADEFEPVIPDDDAADFIVMGELRDLKGQDVFLRALAEIRDRSGQPPTAAIIGDGPAAASLKELATRLGLERAVTFHGPMPARTGFARGRAIVVPSRAESLPYIVLEAAAAGLPLIASRVGGIPEILGHGSPNLVAPDDVMDLANAMDRLLLNLGRSREMAQALRESIRPRFAVEVMAAAIEERYYAALLERSAAQDSRRLSPAE